MNDSCLCGSPLVTNPVRITYCPRGCRGPLVDAGTVVLIEDDYGESVRELTAQRDAALARAERLEKIIEDARSLVAKAEADGWTDCDHDDDNLLPCVMDLIALLSKSAARGEKP